jgi:hypothetical protein
VQESGAGEQGSPSGTIVYSESPNSTTTWVGICPNKVATHRENKQYTRRSYSIPTHIPNRYNCRVKEKKPWCRHAPLTTAQRLTGNPLKLTNWTQVYTIQTDTNEKEKWIGSS